MRKTKHALLLSALSLLVCISMLIGTTFAWFTDSVSSVNNIIKSGNLDIEVSYSLNGTDFTAVGSDPIFPEDDLWEPGFTRVVALKVKNVGTLAAKLDVATEIVSEIEGVNVYDETFKLSDHLEIYCADSLAGVDFSDRASVVGMTPSAFGASLYTDAGILPGEEKVYVLGITMPTTVGNVANHKTGASNRPQITFGLTVLATQLMHEEDSFGNDYDKDATYDEGTSGGGSGGTEIPDGAVVSVLTAGNTAYYTSLQEAFDAAVDGDVLTLMDDVALADGAIYRNDVAAEFDLAGYTLSGNPSTLLSITAGELTVKNGSIKNVIDDASANRYSIALSGDAVAAVSDVNVETTGTGIALFDNATVTELNAKIDSYVTVNGSCAYDAVQLNGNSRVDAITGGEYYSHYSDGFIQAWFESNPKQMSETISYPINLTSDGASIGEISGGTFLGVMDKANNGSPIHVQAGKIETVSDGYFGFWKKGLTNPCYNSYPATTASIGEITGGTFEKGSVGAGFDRNGNLLAIVDASGCKMEETGETVTVDIQFSTKVTTYTLKVLEVVAK